MATITNLNTLKINYLTQAQYETALGNNQIDENELYFTPNSEEVETDPVFKASPAYGITNANISNWNSKTSNTGTVTSVAASGSGGITISGSPITTDGTITVGLNLSTAINGLSEGASPAQLNDYIVAQYAGGGTTTTTYHRRKLSNVIVGKAAADQNGLTIDTGYLKLTGGTVTGSVSFTEAASFSKGATGLTRHYGNLNSLGSGTPAAATKDYFVNSVAQNQTGTAYNTSGSEFALLFGRGGNYGTILKFGYDDLYLYKLRYKNSNWLSNDWEKISAGYADTAGSAPNYLPLTGGNVTGPTTFGDTVSIDDLNAGQLVVNGSASIANGLRVNKITTTGAIAYQGSQATYDMIKWKDNTGDAYGNGIVIGGGGLVVIGGGESADAVAATYSTGGSEELSLTSDGIIKFWTNVQNGAASAHTETIDANGVYSGAATNLASIFTIGSGTSSHATAIKNWFDASKASIKRNVAIANYSSASGNGSIYIGYFLSGYDTNPYGGFFVAHYNNPYYVGISNGTYTQQAILTSTNYTSFFTNAANTSF